MASIDGMLKQAMKEAEAQLSGEELLKFKVQNTKIPIIVGGLYQKSEKGIHKQFVTEIHTGKMDFFCLISESDEKAQTSSKFEFQGTISFAQSPDDKTVTQAILTLTTGKLVTEDPVNGSQTKELDESSGIKEIIEVPFKVGTVYDWVVEDYAKCRFGVLTINEKLIKK